VHSARTRAAILGPVLALFALAGSVSSASALVETSQITSPAGPTYTFYDQTVLSPQIAFTAEGTTNISGKVALRCYYGTTTNSYSTVVSEVTPSGGSFSVQVQASSLRSGPCVLRAVPFANAEPHSPGTASEEAIDPYKGPRVVGSSFELFSEHGVTYDYELESSTLGSYLDIESVGDCGLDYSSLFVPETLATNHLFDCNAALYQGDDPPSGSSTRSELQIDGANAYGPATAHYVNRAINEELNAKSEPPVSIPGAPQVTVTKTFDTVTRLATIHEIDPIVRCSPETIFPPTSKSCTSFVSTGVQLERTWQTSNGDQVVWMTDTWRSTDGAAHSLNALYDQETVNGGKEGAYEFPGASAFSPITKGQMVTLPAGAGRIYYKQDAETPNVGDGEHPQGAIIYDTPPNGQVSVYRSTEAKEGYNGFEMPYQRTIPVGGSYTMRMAFVHVYTLSEAESLAGAVSASYSPTLSIASPANGATVTSSSVTVSGTATDTGALTSLAVNGQAVSVGAGGAWSTSVTLSKGANTITAVATDQVGLSTSKAVSVTYTPPPPPPPVGHAAQVGYASGSNGEVSFTIACQGAAGASCDVESVLSTVEKTRHGKPVAVSARAHGKTRSKHVIVGSVGLVIPAGERVKIAIKLNALGRSLLARFGKLPVHLNVVLVSAGERSTIIAQNITVKPRKAKHHRRGRH
jgi:hypothetical protein